MWTRLCCREVSLWHIPNGRDFNSSPTPVSMCNKCCSITLYPFPKIDFLLGSVRLPCINTKTLTKWTPQDQLWGLTFRENRLLSCQLFEHLGGTGQPIARLSYADVQTQLQDAQLPHGVHALAVLCLLLQTNMSPSEFSPRIMTINNVFWALWKFQGAIKQTKSSFFQQIFK